MSRESDRQGAVGIYERPSPWRRPATWIVAGLAVAAAIGSAVAWLI